MASSTLSLGSLSSASPSPSPPPSKRIPLPNFTSPKKTTIASAATAALDSGSELSELTDDDQDASGAPDKRVAPPAAPSSSKLTQGGSSDDDEDPARPPPHSGSSTSRTAGRGKHQRSSSSRRGAIGRKKRNSIVPAPMWGWAESKASASTAPAEEEEEEDTAGPPKAMEEEEEEEEESEDNEGDEEEDEDNHADELTPLQMEIERGNVALNQRRIAATQHRGRVGHRFFGRGYRGFPGKTAAVNLLREKAWAAQLRKDMAQDEPEDADEEYDHENEEEADEPEKRTRQSAGSAKRGGKPENVEDDDDRPLVNGDDDNDGSASGSEYASTKKKRPVKARVAQIRPKKRKDNASDDRSGSEHPAPSKTKKNGTKVQQRQQVKHNNDDANSDALSAGGDNSTESEDDLPLPLPPNPISPLSPSRAAANAGLKPLSAIASSAAANSAAEALSALAAIAEAVDPTSPSAHKVASINAAAVSASIMAGAASSVEQPPAPASNSFGSGPAIPSDAVSRSRFHTPDDVKSEAELSPDESKPVRGRGSRGGKGGAKGGRGKFRGKASAPATDKKDPPLKVNGTTPASHTAGPEPTSPLPPTPSTKKGPPPPLDLKIDTAFNDPAGKPVIDTADQDMEVDGVEDEVNDRSMEDPDVSMEVEDPEEEEDEEEEEDDGEDEQSIRDEEEEADHVDDEAGDADQDADEEAIEGEGDGDDNEGDGDDDQEQENENGNDPDAAEVEEENEEGEEGENEGEPSPGDADADVDDHESDLQPAHRAEALDVLATIELKFALLRERVYVEKMESLAWEEMMVQSGTHPEMLHLQRELSQRRDKRLELASRKRSYEVANAVTRRKADESGVWSWWKFTRDELQTDMIAETSRKRRRLERERRVVERPQPIRRIPHPPHIDIHNPPPLPNLRKIIKSYPFGSRKQNKSDTHHHHAHAQYPKSLVYPEISTLSAMDINADLEFLFQNRKISTTYDMQQPPHPQHPHHYSQYPPSHQQRNGSGLGMSGPAGMGSINMSKSSSIGMGTTNGVLGPQPPSQMSSSSMMGPPPGSMHQHAPQHGMGYDQYTDMPPSYGPGGPPPPSGRMRDQYQTQGPGGPLSLGPPAAQRESMNPYPSFSGSGGRVQQSHHGPLGHGHGGGYPGERDHEMGTVGPGGNTTGVGHQILPHHPYFGQGSIGPGGGPPPQQSSSASHVPGSHPAKGMNGRRSMSPVRLLNGAGPGSGSKANGSWIGTSSGMGYHLGGGGKGGEWDARMMYEEEERERVMRERERDRKRDDREREREKELRERERDRDRDMERDRRQREHHQEALERERQRDLQHLQQQHHRQSSTLPGSSHASLSHLHAGGAVGPSAQGSGVAPHHHGSHHHHRAHHHHVVHHHHPQGQGSQHASSSLPPSGSGGGVPPIIHSPRDYDRPPLSLLPGSGPGHGHPTEVITLSSGKNPQPPTGPRDRESGHWPTKSSEEHHHPSHLDYRERDRDIRDRDVRKILSHSQRQSSGPPMVPFDDRGDRPMATPFVMASSQTMQQTVAGMSGPHLNGSGLASSTSSPRGPSWNTPAASEDPSYRMPSSSSGPPPQGHIGPSHDVHSRSPVQGHRYPGPPHSSMGRMPSGSSSAHHHRPSSPPIPTPNRSRAPRSPSYSTSIPNAHRSPLLSPKTRPLSPPPSNSSKPQLLSGPPTGPGYASSPHLSGPGRTSTPTGHHQPPTSSASLGTLPSIQSEVVKNGSLPSSFVVGSRTESPLMASLHAPLSGSSGRPSANGMSGNGGNLDRDRIDRERHTGIGTSSVPHPPPPSKLSA
ncbi:hypothetical protein GALMADRAFT_225287 [Galerina marginata CBS 339.88]|uniref:Uncharacterized protein n=1 Tax=Galerina marginata (strain CBS 339.88) TaxID=685588 RepID=A0A067T1Y4_GALM3|nr:hypothetical protein GALMADRAFT_225287 [Galerina marginata CBS 339.88]